MFALGAHISWGMYYYVDDAVDNDAQDAAAVVVDRWWCSSWFAVLYVHTVSIFE